MKKITTRVIEPARPAVVETVVTEEKDGLEILMGQRVTLLCNSYFYTGKLVGVNADCVKLSEAKVVYETGPLTKKEWGDAQDLPNDWYVMKSAIESYGILK